MIIDHIERAPLYNGIGARIRAALEYLAKTDFSGMKDGRHDIDGDKVFALVQRYETKPRNQGKWETHRRYIDVQYVASGAEVMGYAPAGGLTVIQPYSGERDCTFYTGAGDFVTACAGTFIVFFPEDAHMPCLACETPVPVVKVVVKVAVE